MPSTVSKFRGSLQSSTAGFRCCLLKLKHGAPDSTHFRNPCKIQVFPGRDHIFGASCYKLCTRAGCRRPAVSHTDLQRLAREPKRYCNRPHKLWIQALLWSLELGKISTSHHKSALLWQQHKQSMSSQQVSRLLRCLGACRRQYKVNFVLAAILATGAFTTGSDTSQMSGSLGLAINGELGVGSETYSQPMKSQQVPTIGSDSFQIFSTLGPLLNSSQDNQEFSPNFSTYLITTSSTSQHLIRAVKQLAEPLPILGDNTTSQPIRRLFLYSPLHLTNYITTTTPLPRPV